LGVLKGLANATIATSYLKKGGGSVGGGSRPHEARWRPGEKALRARLEVGLWTQRLANHQRLQAELQRMENAVDILRESLATLQRCSLPVREALGRSINVLYLEELLVEAVGALADEGVMCHDLVQRAGHATTQDSQVLHASAWAARPLLQEHRRQALKDLVQVVLSEGEA
jgi:Asp-tRNA(Asn)/Glu-tRNA(Gln) amidotransferase A subunit family amidase